MNVITGTLLCFLFLTIGCKTDTKDQHLSDQRNSITVNQYTIPVLPTPQEQYSYTRSWFKDHKEKLAALEAVIQLFPKARLQCGMASLDLVYAGFGTDYRLTPKKDCRHIAKAYKNILKEYSGTPEILAKAHWYLGWIYTDLMGDTTKGLDHYRTIISTYPQIKRRLNAPIEWVSLLPTSEEVEPKSTRLPTDISWAQLAALEIIRHSQNDTDNRQALKLLQENQNHPNLLGIGFKLFFQHSHVPEDILREAHTFLDNSRNNEYLKNDIETLLGRLEIMKNPATREIQ